MLVLLSCRYPSKRGWVPRLVWILISSQDTRIEEENSILFKSLKSLVKLGLVDKKNPNVVGVITHSCSFPTRKPDVWAEKIKRKSAVLKDVMFKNLKVSAEVVTLENMYGPDSFDLPIHKDGKVFLWLNLYYQQTVFQWPWYWYIMDKGAFINDVRCFSGIFDLPTYPHQILYYISLFSKIRWGFVIYECSLMSKKKIKKLPNYVL